MSRCLIIAQQIYFHKWKTMAVAIRFLSVTVYETSLEVALRKNICNSYRDRKEGEKGKGEREKREERREGE